MSGDTERYQLGELMTLMEAGRVRFTDWEQNFIESLSARDLSRLSERQRTILTKLYEEKTS